MLSSLRVNGDDPGYIADAVFDRLVYGIHPYGLPGSGTEDSLAALTREDHLALNRLALKRCQIAPPAADSS